MRRRSRPPGGAPITKSGNSARALITAGGRQLTMLGTLGAVLATGHAAYNCTRLPAPSTTSPPIEQAVSVLLPVRDEADRVGSCLQALLAQTDVRRLEVIVLDDGSTDRTAQRVREVAADDPRLCLLAGRQPVPAGWLGKSHACQQLADAARGEVLVFVDADVVLAPHAVAATVALLRRLRVDLVSPYPRQLADGLAARVLQPLLQWSWLTFLPLALAYRSPRPALSAANGQLLAVDAAAYRRAGGHAAVRGEVVEDVALLRAVKRTGGRGGVADGTALATCRMYDDWTALRDGYTKSLWSAFGSPTGAVAALAALALLYVVPPVAALRGSRTGRLGYAAGVLGRVLTARRTGGRSWPDPLAHPASVMLLGYLTGRSWALRRSGAIRWKGRAL